MEGLASEILEFQPDVVLLDWELPGRPAAALLFALHGVEAKPKVIVMSVRPEAEAAALEAGADAFVSKGDWPERLLDALRRLSLN
jgi:DNA-binding response OmpR family regulator